MKLSDGTIIAVRQAPEQMHNQLIELVQLALEAHATQPQGVAALTIANTIGPWVGEVGAAVDPRDLACFLVAHQEDLRSILAAVLGVSERDGKARHTPPTG